MEDKQESLKYIKQSFELKNQKLYKEAIEVLYKVLVDDVEEKTLIEVISQIGDLHLLLNNYDRAIEQFESVLEMDKNHEYSKNKLFEIYFKLKEYDKAAKIAKEGCENSLNPYDYIKYFTVLLRLKQPDKIIEIYNTLDENLKKNPEIMYITSFLKFEEKENILKEIIKNAPDFADPKLDLAIIYYGKSQFDEAKKLLEDTIKLKKDALAYYYKALIEIQEKEFFQAIDNLHTAIKISKGNIPEFYFVLAQTYMDINWFDEAINTIKNSITLYIKNGINIDAIDKSYLFLAWVFEKLGDFDNAIFNLGLISKNSKVNNEAEILKALIEYKKGHVVKAKNRLEKLYANCPDVQNDLTLIDTLGDIYKALKLNNKAKIFFEKHLQNFPDSIHTACELVDLLIDMEEYDSAEKYIQEYSRFGKVLSFINSKARIAYRKNDLNGALSFLDELIESDKNNAESYYFKGLILNQMKKYKDAFLNIKTALELNPLPAKYYAQAAISKSGLSDFNEAMLYVREAIEIEPNDLNYKRLASQISKEMGEESQVKFWQSIIKGTEKIIKDNQRL